MRTARFSSTASLWMLALVISFTLVEGRHRVIGSGEPVVAAVGSDAILPCRVEPELNVEDMTFEWSTPDPKHPQTQVIFLYVHRDRSELTAMKNAFFKDRTTLSLENLKHGNISLKILNVTLRDIGRYKCLVHRLDGEKQEGTVELIIASSSNSLTTETPLHPTEVQTPGLTKEVDHTGRPVQHFGLVATLVVLLLLVAGIVATFLFKIKHPMQHDVIKIPAVDKTTSPFDALLNYCWMA
ncbi:myelin-oligodendrocyte glycoprotein-like [Thalassophryne amazonica]|uniref:myelin-oligodendrocyte glycoprotein-like n=1 Tax=Thalassophryne amazonica TaxID=390379 RepID=UPI001470E775|nr:myelin-oligodendrocyte glycoprotein-like [Thalassophryne amazonica]